MKASTLIAAAALCAPCLAQTAAQPVSGGAAPRPSELHDALSKGTLTLEARLRHEYVDQENLPDPANAVTLRTRLGYRTAPYKGLSAMLEAQNTVALVDDYQEPGRAANGLPVVADPERTEVSQAWLGYAYAKSELRAGRQNLVLDNARFIGNVGWRQSGQTLDAVTLRSTALEGWTGTYGYLWGVKRVFGNPSNTAFADFESDSHILHLSYSKLPVGTLTGYAYLLDFENSPPNSSATTGLSYSGAAKLDADWSLPFRLEYASQADYGNNPASYRADYLCAELGVRHRAFSVLLGWEILGSDDGRAFRTPLATLHAFNGWADLFLNTPAVGLSDTYLQVGTRVGPVDLAATWHHFMDDSRSTDLGQELDAQATWKPHKTVTLLLKLAWYQADNFGTDTLKLITQAEYRF